MASSPPTHPILVTGATDGIGFETALGLARAGRSVLVHGRNHDRAQSAVLEINRRVPGASLRAVHADYAILDEVRELGRRFLAQGEPLGGVVHNAGALFSTRSLTTDGWEATWQVNHLAPFLLHAHLSALLAGGNQARVVWVSSNLHRKGTIPWDDLNSDHAWDRIAAYNASKLANALVAFRIARTHAPSYLASFALHPGVVGTKMLRQGFGIDGIGADEGARTSLFAMLDPSLARKTGLYLDACRVAEPSTASRDEDLQDRLWTWTTSALGT